MLRAIVDRAIVPLCRNIRPVGTLVTYVSKNIEKDGYSYVKDRFIQNDEHSEWSKDIRSEIVKRFEIIDRMIPIATTPTEGLFLAEALLSLNVEGDIVECGCYFGGSTAKISIVAKILNRKLLVFDSFEGLPQATQNNIRDYHVRRSSEWVTDWTLGRYAARLDQVKSNIEMYGEICACTFIKGWFNNILKTNVPNNISFTFTDVDIASSAKECLDAIWPKISNGGVYFSHDIAYIKVLQSMLDEELWVDKFKEFPPIIFGAGYGLGDSAPHLGFMVKGKAITAEYINSLTIDK